MNLPSEESGQWVPCEPGLLAAYARRKSRRRLLKIAAATIGTAGCVALACVVGWRAYLRRLETEHQFFGMTCADVRELMQSYRLGRLDAARSAVLAKHVRRCPRCAEFRDELRDEVA